MTDVPFLCPMRIRVFGCLRSFASSSSALSQQAVEVPLAWLVSDAGIVCVGCVLLSESRIVCAGRISSVRQEVARADTVSNDIES